MKVVITGTPGVGKHTIAESLSTIMGKIPILDINGIILSENLLTTTSENDDDNNKEVDIQKSYEFLTLLLSKDKFQNSIIVGHLAPYVINSQIVDLVVILRRSPYELKKIYQKRCYSDSKTRANINAEILGILSYDASKNFDFSKLSELENSSNLLPSSVAQSIYDMCLNAKSRSFGFIDWISLIQSDSEMLKYIK
ncbi:MAG TPA: AAA family ATPase [Candidatus Nitrosocosmicus sp.]|nr:AAA family ATPase [Candidatus Nitrosocosmicus sp.]